MNMDWINDAKHLRMVETFAILLTVMVIRIVIKRVVKKTLVKYQFSYQREKIILKTSNLATLTLSIISIAAIWGLNSSQIFTYLTSILAVIGIAFFAQWSLLSNITAGIILFFNHPLKLGDYLKIIDKDTPLEGTVEDISFFFLHIRTNENHRFTIPNTVVIQKILSIEISNKKEESIDE